MERSICSSRAAWSWTGPVPPGFRAAIGGAGRHAVVVLSGRRDGGREAVRTIDATGHVVAPGFIDVHSHSGLMILAEPRHEPKVRQGVTTEVIGVDGNSYAPFRSRADLLAFARLNAGLDGLPDASTSTGPRRTAICGASTGRSASTWRSWWATRHCASTPLAGMTCPPTGPRWTGCVASCGSPWRRGRSGCRRGSTTRRVRSRPRPSWRRSPPRPHASGGIYHTHVRYALGDRFLDPFREAIEIGRAGQRSGPHHPLLPAGHGSGSGRADDRARRGRPRRRAGRDLGHLSLRVGEHAAADHAAAMGPGGRPRAAPGAPRRPGHPRSGSGASWPSAARAYAGPHALGRPPPGCAAHRRLARMGGPDPRAS